MKRYGVRLFVCLFVYMQTRYCTLAAVGPADRSTAAATGECGQCYVVSVRTLAVRRLVRFNGGERLAVEIDSESQQRVIAVHESFNCIRHVAPMCTASNTRFLEPTARVCSLNGISIRLAGFAGLTGVPDTHTHTHTHTHIDTLGHHERATSAAVGRRTCMRCGLQTLQATTELLRSTTELPELADYVPDRVQEVPDSRQQVACRSIGLTGPDEDIHRQALFSAIFVLMYYLAFSSKVLFRFDYRFFAVKSSQHGEHTSSSSINSQSLLLTGIEIYLKMTQSVI